MSPLFAKGNFGLLTKNRAIPAIYATLLLSAYLRLWRPWRSHDHSLAAPARAEQGERVPRENLQNIFSHRLDVVLASQLRLAHTAVR